MAKAMKFGSGRAKRYNEGGALEVPEKGTGLKKETRGEAFNRARRTGEKTFEFEGKKYTTETKEEKDAREAAALAKKPDESTAETARLSRASKTEAKPKTEDKKKQDEPVPFMKRPIKPEYTKEVNDALTMGLQGGILSKEIPKLMGHLRASKDVAKRVEPTLNAPKASGAQKFAVSEARKEASKEPAQRAIEAQRKAARREAERTGEGRDYSEYKKGGKVKKMASGGMARSASSRADGCAIRGKTRA